MAAVPTPRRSGPATSTPIGGSTGHPEGEVFANVWHSDRIARIDPATGHVVAWITVPFSRFSLGLTEPEAVLNGIAYEPSTRRLLLTGKLWPVMFEVELVAAE